MRKISHIVFFILLIGCKEVYDSPVESPVTGYLVVEGTINSGKGNTNIRLTRTTKLGNETIIFEKKAQVKVEGENNISYNLLEKTTGNYSADNLNLANTQKYRLRIKTSAGKEYLSDFVEVKKNPPIDAISWKKENDGGLQLYIETHDDQNKTLYYQWEYTETWEFHAVFYPNLKYRYVMGVPQSVIYHDPITHSYDSTIAKCWQTNSSTSLQLGSTVKLSKDVVYLPLVAVPSQSWKLSVLYSIIATQYSWTKEGYEFLEKMKKNTEITGSVFDEQPSELKGNIHNVADPFEPVIGFVNICNIEQKRIWIASSDVPDWGYRLNCPDIEVENNPDSIAAKASDKLPIFPIDQLGNGILTFSAAPRDCVDCTLRGTNKKPAFWP